MSNIKSTNGFCYHCFDCNYKSIYVEGADDHSRHTKHYLRRLIRSKCEYHIKLLEKFG